MSINSKRKGNRGEARIAKLLNEFTGKKFRRTPASGGFNKQGAVIAEHVFSGDVICNEANFLFSVENKNQSSKWSFSGLMCSPNKAPFTSWWFQTLNDAKSVNKKPLLFFKTQNSSNSTVGAENVAIIKEDFKYLFEDKKVPHFVFNIFDNVTEINVNSGKSVEVVSLDYKLPNPYIINWRNFIKYTDPSKMFGE